MITGAPWTLAGHVRGAWRLEQPGRAPFGQPFPGVLLASPTLASFDSVHVGHRAGVGAPGMESALAELHGLPARRVVPRARSVLSFVSGGHGLEDNLLTFERGDSLGWVSGEASSATRGGGFGGWELVSRHRWGFGLGVARGAHRLEGTYAQRGGAARLTGGDQQSSRGESGHAQYGYWGNSIRTTIRGSRGYDVHESFGTFLAASRRDAQENRLLGSLAWVRGGSTVHGAVEWRRTRVVRVRSDAFAARDDAVWGELGWGGPTGEGWVEIELAGGRRLGIEGFQWAPAVRYAFAAGDFSGRLRAERLLEPVWTDLAPGQTAFLQDTWVGGIEVGAGQAAMAGVAGTGVTLGFTAGQTHDRALVSRQPIEELWLRSGFRADPGRYVFGLLSGRASWQGRHLEGGAEAFALARDRSPTQAQVDPGHGFRAFGGTRLVAFAGDLLVTLRLEVEGVGPRESELARSLPGHVSLSATASFTLADAVLTLALRNLEDVRREHVWIDPATGVEALGLGREFRLRLTWKLLG